jgi:hypothetical protein
MKLLLLAAVYLSSSSEAQDLEQLEIKTECRCDAIGEANVPLCQQSGISDAITCLSNMGLCEWGPKEDSACIAETK